MASRALHWETVNINLFWWSNFWAAKTSFANSYISPGTRPGPQDQGKKRTLDICLHHDQLFNFTFHWSQSGPSGPCSVNQCAHSRIVEDYSLSRSLFECCVFLIIDRRVNCPCYQAHLFCPGLWFYFHSIDCQTSLWPAPVGICLESGPHLWTGLGSLLKDEKTVKDEYSNGEC